MESNENCYENFLLENIYTRKTEAIDLKIIDNNTRVLFEEWL